MKKYKNDLILFQRMNDFTEVEFGVIPKEWGLLPLKKLHSNVHYAVSMGPFGSNIKVDNFVKYGVPVIRGSNLNTRKYVLGDFAFITEEKADELRSSNCKEDDLVFTHRGTIGQVALIPKNEYPRYVISQSGMKFTPDKSKINPDFLFYFFISKYGQHQLLKYESQVGVPSISNPLTSLKEIEVPVPPLPEQKSIAGVLSALDDKIDLLHRQNNSLEMIADVIFRKKVIDELPKNHSDWKTFKIGDKLDVILGGTPSTKRADYWDGDVPWINSGEVNKQRIISPTRFITKLGLENSNTKLLPKETTVLAITGATLGQISRLEIDCCANQSVIGIPGNQEFSNNYIYLWIKNFLREIILRQTGGAQQHINTSDVKDTEIILLPEKTREELDDLLNPIFNKISHNIFQTLTLEKLRDLLLPKLMSGEVRVRYGQDH